MQDVKLVVCYKHVPGCVRYDYGIFCQRVENGWQVEEPDQWLKDGNPWEIVRHEYTQRVQYYGHVTVVNGRREWTNTQVGTCRRPSTQDISCALKSNW